MSQGYTVEPSTNEVEDSQFNSHRDWGKLRQKTSTVSDAKSGKQKDSELSEFLEQLSEALLSGEDKASVTRGDAGERSVEERLRVAKEQYEQNMRRATTYNERAEIKEDYEAFVKSLKATSDASKEEERQQLKRELENLRIKEMNASTSGKVDLVDRIMAVKQRIAELSKNTGDKHGTDCDCADCTKMHAHDAYVMNIRQEGDYWIAKVHIGLGTEELKFPVGANETKEDALRYAERKLEQRAIKDAGLGWQVVKSVEELKLYAGMEAYPLWQSSAPGGSFIGVDGKKYYWHWRSDNAMILQKVPDAKDSAQKIIKSDTCKCNA